MSTPPIPSKLLNGEAYVIREHSFTRWVSRDLLQATTDFCKNIGLSAIYAECNPQGLGRYLLWHPPEIGSSEIRSGRTKEQFEKIDQENQKRGWSLLTLHISENQIYSAVWVSSDRLEVGKKLLSVYGITLAERKAGE